MYFLKKKYDKIYKQRYKERCVLKIKYSMIKYAFYINLENRTDRRKQVEEELQSVDIQNAERFNAIRLANGRIGCSMSHLKCLKLAQERKWPYVMICEDDVQFLNPDLFKKQLSEFLSNQKSWDVVLLAGNNMPPHTIVRDDCVKVTRCQTTTAYIVNTHYYNTLMTNIKNGMELLMKEPEKHFLYAIDKYWFQLQQTDNWYLITPLSVIQREGYSDIESRMTNYRHLMTDLNKNAFRQSWSL